MYALLGLGKPARRSLHLLWPGKLAEKGTAARIRVRGKCRLCSSVCEGSGDSGTAQTLVVDRVAVALSTAFDDERRGVAVAGQPVVDHQMLRVVVGSHFEI